MIRLSDGSLTPSSEDVDRWNRIWADVFWIRHGREYDPSDPADHARGEAIMRWQCEGAPLRGESVRETHDRMDAQRAINELTAIEEGAP
jgi:hypothetical protein